MAATSTHPRISKRNIAKKESLIFRIAPAAIRLDSKRRAKQAETMIE
jgi:hypothetical protein